MLALEEEEGDQPIPTWATEFYVAAVQSLQEEFHTARVEIETLREEFTLLHKDAQAEFGTNGKIPKFIHDRLTRIHQLELDVVDLEEVDKARHRRLADEGAGETERNRKKLERALVGEQAKAKEGVKEVLLHLDRMKEDVDEELASIRPEDRDTEFCIHVVA